MPYSIKKFNGDPVGVIADGTVDQSLAVKLIGKNYAGYGEIQNENFVYLLENFASENPPSKKTAGQLWFDSSSKKLKVYDDSISRFKTISGAEIDNDSGLSQGEFFWDTTTSQLSVSNGDGTYTLVGPQGIAGANTTEMKSVTVVDDEAPVAGEHNIIKGISNGTVIFIISNDEFTLGDGNPIDGFDTIYKGITSVNSGSTTDGITGGDYRYRGTATSADGLNVSETFVPSSSFVRNDEPSGFTSLVSFDDPGFTVGTTPKFKISIVSDIPIVENFVGEKIQFKTKVDGVSTSVVELNRTSLRPITDFGASLGGPSNRFDSIYASTFNGAATKADTLKIGTLYYSAITTNNPSVTITSPEIVAAVPNDIDTGDPANNEGRKINATVFAGVATSAIFADLAEKYLPDESYEVGTVMVVGGEAEVTACQRGQRAFGVISEKPAFRMNENLEGGVFVALKGRVPVKVLGPVTKGDRLVASSNGCAGAAHILLVGQPVKASTFPDTFAIALESSSETGVKLIESIIL